MIADRQCYGLAIAISEGVELGGFYYRHEALPFEIRLESKFRTIVAVQAATYGDLEDLCSLFGENETAARQVAFALLQREAAFTREVARSV